MTRPNEFKHRAIETTLQHAGSEHRLGQGLVGALEQSVTYKTPNVEDPPVYSRLGNTANHRELETLLALLHGGELGLATGSGMAAELLVFMTLARPGDHILSHDICYGGTYNILTKILKQWGVETTFAPMSEWARHVRSNTRFVCFESITNPFCVPQNVKEAASFAKRHNLISVCDNTFASPMICRPLDLGVDIVFESATKYLNGHSDVIAGVVVGAKQFMERMQGYHAYLGTFLPPPQCMQLLRGLRTLKLRMDAHSANGAAFAKGVKLLKGVAKVYYGTSEPFADQFQNSFGGMIAVDFKADVSMKTFLSSLKFISDVPSLGGTETTATCPYYTTNWFMSEDQRAKLGISSHLVRFSIGLENPSDLIFDIAQALEKSF